MDVEQTTMRAQAEDALKERFLERLEKLVRQTREDLARERSACEFVEEHAETISSLSDIGWTLWGARDMGRSLHIDASATVEGEEVRYSLAPYGEEWTHEFKGLGVENEYGIGIYRHAPAGVIASPEAVLRLLRETIEFWRERCRSDLESEVYRYLLSGCAPGEEPDSEEFERVTEEHWARYWTSGGELQIGSDLDDAISSADHFDEDRLFVVAGSSRS